MSCITQVVTALTPLVPLLDPSHTLFNVLATSSQLFLVFLSATACTHSYKSESFAVLPLAFTMIRQVTVNWQISMICLVDLNKSRPRQNNRLKAINLTQFHHLIANRISTANIQSCLCREKELFRHPVLLGQLFAAQLHL